MKLRVILIALVVLAGLYFLNRRMNETPRYRDDSPSTGTTPGGEVRAEFTVGFIPVTCHLTCPVTSWVTDHSTAGTRFKAQKFQDFAAMKEALAARKIDATFMITPLAMKMAEDGQPVKIVYLGHRDGSAIIVPLKSPIKDFAELKGKTVAIPGRFSNQNILMRKMMKQYGMKDGDITLKELPPPEHPTALAAGVIDAYIIGEPFAAKAELDGTGRVLYQCGELWPDFISCGLVVRQEVIDQKRALVEELVRGIATSGKWLDQDKDNGAQHRKDAAMVVGKMFYNQKPELLAYVLTKDVNRVRYTGLKPPKERFDEMMQLGVEMGLFPRFMKFEEYCDTSFAPDLETLPVTFDRLPEIDKVTAQ